MIFFFFSELSEVLWTMVLKIGLNFGADSVAMGVISIFILFSAWAGM